MIEYEKAVKSDFMAVAALDRLAWEGYRNSGNIPDGEHVWRVWTEHALMFVAREDKEVIGAVIAFPSISRAWYVHKLFVRQDRKKQKIGTRLLTRLLEEIDELGAESFLTVDPQNKKLIAFYETLGFTEKKLVQGYYRDDEDRFVLTRKGN